MTILVAELGTNWWPGLERPESPVKAAQWDRQVLDAVDSLAQNFDVLKIQLWRNLYNSVRAPKQHQATVNMGFPQFLIPDARRICQQHGTELWCSIFDEDSLECASSFDCLKVASGDLTNERLIRAVSKSCIEHNLPMVLSTGAGTLKEIWQAQEWIDVPSLTLMHCVSAYPALESDYQLKGFLNWVATEGVVAGLSDHTVGTNLGLTATVLGYQYIEKHVRPFCQPYGSDPPDWSFAMSLEDAIDFKEQLKAIDALVASSDFTGFRSCEAEERYWARRGSDGLRPSDSKEISHE